jgi:hypothetical protein
MKWIAEAPAIQPTVADPARVKLVQTFPWLSARA